MDDQLKKQDKHIRILTEFSQQQMGLTVTGAHHIRTYAKTLRRSRSPLALAENRIRALFQAQPVRQKPSEVEEAENKFRAIFGFFLETADSSGAKSNPRKTTDQVISLIQDDLASPQPGPIRQLYAVNDNWFDIKELTDKVALKRVFRRKTLAKQ